MVIDYRLTTIKETPVDLIEAINRHGILFNEQVFNFLKKFTRVVEQSDYFCIEGYMEESRNADFGEASVLSPDVLCSRMVYYDPTSANQRYEYSDPEVTRLRNAFVQRAEQIGVERGQEAQYRYMISEALDYGDIVKYAQDEELSEIWEKWLELDGKYRIHVDFTLRPVPFHNAK